MEFNSPQGPKTSAIVPAYNEEATIAEVVRTLAGSPLLDEVIVISDGSTDRTAELARQAGASLVHELPLKKGKGAAMLHGVTHATSPIIAFFDSDLRGLRAEHVEQILLPVITGARTMNVGMRDKGPFFTSLARHLPLIGGERALKRSVIESIPPELVQGFMVESALNYYCRSKKLRYGSVVLKGLTMRRKFEKVGLVKSLGEYARMTWQVVKAMAVVRLARARGKF